MGADPAPRHFMQNATYHLYSIWLFTLSDIKTIILPSVLFSVLTAPALSVFDISATISASELLRRAPSVLFWLWINLLPMTIDNQRQVRSIAEDGINKPWRTMPSKRMTSTQARNLMLCLWPISITTSFFIGGLEQCLSLIALGAWYNDFRGGDSSIILRNLLNAAGFNRYAEGALEVLLGGRRLYSPKFLIWQLILMGIVFTTVQTQDMHDQIGDSKRGRRTIPLIMGDIWARWSIAIPVVLWSIFCPVYISAPVEGYVVSIGMGGLVAARSLLLRNVPADSTTWTLWNFWLVALYVLPLLKVALLNFGNWHVE